MDKTLLTPEQYRDYIEANNKFKEYWNTHPEFVKDVCRRFAEKFVDAGDVILENERWNMQVFESGTVTFEL